MSLFTVAPVPLIAQGAGGETVAVPALPITPGPEFVDTADPVLPGAEEVVSDVQSAMFWSRYQTGNANGWSYILFPDGSARILPEGGQRTAAYTLSCTSGVACEVKRADGTSYRVLATGAARPSNAAVTDGETLSRYLADWILAGTGTPPAPPTPAVLPESTPLEADTTNSAATGGEEKTETQQIAEVESAAGDATVDEAEVTAEDLESSAGEDSGQTNPVEDTAQTAQSNVAAPEDSSCPELPGFVPNVCDPVPSTPRADRPRTTSSAEKPTSETAKDEEQPAAPKEEDKTWLQRANLQCYITGSFSLRYTDPDTDSTGPGKPRVNFGCSGRLHPRLSFQLFFREYLKPEQQQPWDPDFTYAFTFKVSDKFSLTYSNYLARFDGPNGEGSLKDSLTSGTLRGNYSLPRYELPNGEAMACVIGAGFPDFPKERLTLSCGAGITKKLRVGATAYLYFPGQQDTYQPDYSYTASYKISEKYRLSYSNYSNNRWNFNEGDDPGPGFVGGSLSLTYTIKF